MHEISKMSIHYHYKNVEVCVIWLGMTSYHIYFGRQVLEKNYCIYHKNSTTPSYLATCTFNATEVQTISQT